MASASLTSTRSRSTGIVHSAPAYGVDDFNSCVAHGLKYDDILNPVQGNGVYEAELPLFGGQHIWKANPVITQALRDAGRLMAEAKITHSYPHCWRHKTPVIYRAAAQWFVRMDEGPGVFTKDKAGKTLRQLALDAIDAMTSLADFVSGSSEDQAPTTDRAFIVWSGTELATYRTTSAVELYGANGRLIRINHFVTE